MDAADKGTHLGRVFFQQFLEFFCALATRVQPGEEVEVGFERGPVFGSGVLVVQLCPVKTLQLFDCDG